MPAQYLSSSGKHSCKTGAPQRSSPTFSMTLLWFIGDFLLSVWAGFWPPGYMICTQISLHGQGMPTHWLHLLSPVDCESYWICHNEIPVSNFIKGRSVPQHGKDISLQKFGLNPDVRVTTSLTVTQIKNFLTQSVFLSMRFNHCLPEPLQKVEIVWGLWQRFLFCKYQHFF